jgi:hypothetical protein
MKILSDFILARNESSQPATCVLGLGGAGTLLD